MIHNLAWGVILLHPPPNPHLALDTCTDPSLPPVTFRADIQVTENCIRVLSFNQDDTQRLFQKVIGIPIDWAIVDQQDARSMLPELPREAGWILHQAV